MVEMRLEVETARLEETYGRSGKKKEMGSVSVREEDAED